MFNTKYISTQDVIDKLQSLKRKTKLKFYPTVINYSDRMGCKRRSKSYDIKENPLSKIAESIRKIYQELLLLMKLLQTKPQVQSFNIEYKDLCYTVIKSRDEKEIETEDEHENDDRDSNG